MFGSSSFSVVPFGQSSSVPAGSVSAPVTGVSAPVTGVSALCLTPNPTEENGGAITENSFTEAPFASENSVPFVITVNSGVSISVTGLQATAQTSGVVFNTPVSVTGSVGTGAVGSVVVVQSQSVSVTGVSATGTVGGNRAELGGFLFGGLSFAEEPFAGLADDISSTVNVVTGASDSVTGLSATGAVGTASVTGTAVTPVTGVTATGQAGSVSVIQSANVSVTGVAATGSVGAVAAVIEGTGATVAITSPRLQGQVGIVAPNAQIKVFVAGVAGTGQTSGASVVSWNEIIVNQDPNWVEIAA